MGLPAAAVFYWITILEAWIKVEGKYLINPWYLTETVTLSGSSIEFRKNTFKCRAHKLWSKICFNLVQLMVNSVDAIKNDWLKWVKTE